MSSYGLVLGDANLLPDKSRMTDVIDSIVMKLKGTDVANRLVKAAETAAANMPNR